MRRIDREYPEDVLFVVFLPSHEAALALYNEGHSALSCVQSDTGDWGVEYAGTDQLLYVFNNFITDYLGISVVHWEAA